MISKVQNMTERKTEKQKNIWNSKPLINIGKSGITENLIKEAKTILKKKKLIKVRILRSALVNSDVQTLAQEFASQTNSTLIETRGNTFIVSKR